MYNTFDVHRQYNFDMRKTVGLFGLALAAAFFVWLLAGLIPAIPSMVEVFGVPGLRIPAAVAVAGLLLAALGFWEN